MALHFDLSEFEARRTHVLEEMARRRLDAMLLFAPESHYWLTGYDTFGYTFFQCLVLTRTGEFALLTRSADLRQARQTSLIDNIAIWTDKADAGPGLQLRDLLNDLGLLGSRIGVEYDTHGLTAANGRKLDQALKTFGTVEDASDLIPALRVIKSPAELAYVRRAAELADDALDAGLRLIRAGADEGDILAAMQGRSLFRRRRLPGQSLYNRFRARRPALPHQDRPAAAGRDRPDHAGIRRRLSPLPRALMRTVLVGELSPRHRELHAAAEEALAACEAAMQPGRTFGEVFDAHARVMDDHGMTKHRLAACGYSLGARYAPSWMEWPMFYRDNPAVIAPDMVLFAHMILMDSDAGAAMCLGRTYLTTAGAPQSLSRHGTDLLVR
jgi:Xaa-Pro dipeptidase